MIRSILAHIAAGIAGLLIADRFAPGVHIFGPVELLLTAGAVLGIINAVLRPILQTITLPIRILSLGLSSFAVNMLLVWAVDILFAEVVIPGVIGLFWTTIAVWGAGIVVSPFFRQQRT